MSKTVAVSDTAREVVARMPKGAITMAEFYALCPVRSPLIRAHILRAAAGLKLVRWTNDNRIARS